MPGTHLSQVNRVRHSFPTLLIVAGLVESGNGGGLAAALYV